MYRSNPDAPTAVGLRGEFERLAREVYVGVRDGVVDCEVVFDLACLLMGWGQPDPVVEELAALAAEGACHASRSWQGLILMQVGSAGRARAAVHVRFAIG